MKVVIYSDIHHNMSGHSIRSDGKNIRLMDSISVQDQVFDYILHDQEVCEVWFLGDMFEKKDKLPVPTVQECVSSFDRFFKRLKVANRQIKVKLLVGNHDRYKPTGKFKDYTILSYLNGFENIAIISKPTIELISNVSISWLPWEKDYTSFQESIASIMKTTEDKYSGYKHILLLHQGIAGGKVGNNNIILESDISPDSIQPNYFDLILSGHYHKHQILYHKGKGNIIYVGSPLQIDWGEVGDTTKGFMVLDLNTQLQYKLIQTTFPEYCQIEANSMEMLFHAENLVKDGKVRREMLKVITEEQEIVETMPKELLCKYIPKRHTMEDTNITYDIIEDNEKLIRRYLQSLPNEAFKGLNKKTLFSMGMQILTGK